MPAHPIQQDYIYLYTLYSRIIYVCTFYKVELYIYLYILYSRIIYICPAFMEGLFMHKVGLYMSVHPVQQVYIYTCTPCVKQMYICMYILCSKFYMSVHPVQLAYIFLYSLYRRILYILTICIKGFYISVQPV